MSDDQDQAAAGGTPADPPADDLAFPRPEQPPMDDAAAGPTGDADEDGRPEDPSPGPVADTLGDFA